MSLTLGLIIAIVCLVGVRCHGCLTLVGAFLAGCAAYSVPAVIGLYIPPFRGAMRGFAEVSFDAQLIVAFAWLVIGACLLAGCAFRARTRGHRLAPVVTEGGVSHVSRGR